jgi:hypothetical protein
MQTSNEGMQTSDAGIQVGVETEDRATQPDTLYATLIKRYMEKVHQVMNMLNENRLRWNVSDLTFKDPPGMSVVTVVEHLAARSLRTRDTAVLTIEKILFPTVASPSATSVARSLTRKQSTSDEKRAKLFDRHTKTAYDRPFKE